MDITNSMLFAFTFVVFNISPAIHHLRSYRLPEKDLSFMQKLYDKYVCVYIYIVHIAISVCGFRFAFVN